MNRLADRPWRPHYTPDHGDLVEGFYLPALACATRYDRTTGYFNAPALALAMRGLEGLIRNGGRMRLLVGCTLDAAEVAAIEQGEQLRATVAASLLRLPLEPPDQAAVDALELLAWMIARGILEVKVAVPCDGARQPVAGIGLFHAKAGIIEDGTGDRLAFNGSINETAAAWLHNYETFHVYTSWDGGSKHVDAEEWEFQTLWNDKSRRALVLDVPTAKRDQLLRFLPPDDQPARLSQRDPDVSSPVTTPPARDAPPGSAPDPRQVVWSFLRLAPALPAGGERVGEATAAITPWPHQIRAFERLYQHWPPRLLIADEVGLGKTIQAGLLLRQAWLSGRAKRILILAPKAVLRQWQIELREKFNLNWPIYDGQRLTWRGCPAWGPNPNRAVARSDWHHESCVIVSSHLMRRADRARELIEQAAPWDLVILDEAHHARRRAGGLGTDNRPNQLLRLMRQFRERAGGLVLLTATPMQVSPIEVWDLLALLGLPADWTPEAFLRFFEISAKPSPSHADLATLAGLFRAVEAHFGPLSEDEAQRFSGVTSRIRIKKLLRALREAGSIPLRQLETTDRQAVLRLLRAATPVRRLISRHTRRLLRRYYEAGKITTPIATREVEDRFVTLSPAESQVYQAVEDYISSTYNNTAAERKTAVGFVMTIYRRRLASSFLALAQTLETRLETLDAGRMAPSTSDRLEEDLSDDEAEEDLMDTDEAEQLELEALKQEERGDIEDLIRAIRRLPTDTKARELLTTIEALRDQGYGQVMVFTQYTDTLDFLRGFLVDASPLTVMCFSGRGGEVRATDGTWTRITRDRTKELFRQQAAQILICTDAAAEGLNFQFCGALINYDLPWNPMRVEQRIGRIDRLGQRYPRIRIVNLHYQDTVETDVYMALRHRIQLFETFVGGLQPILSQLPKAIRDVTLIQGDERRRETAALVDRLAQEADDSEHLAFDLDAITEGDIEEAPRPAALYDLQDLERILRQPRLLPPGDEIRPAGAKDFAYLRPGMAAPVRVTTDPAYFEAHAESVELWSPGSPVFPEVSEVEGAVSVDVAEFRRIIPYVTD